MSSFIEEIQLHFLWKWDWNGNKYFSSTLYQDEDWYCPELTWVLTICSRVCNFRQFLSVLSSVVWKQRLYLANTYSLDVNIFGETTLGPTKVPPCEKMFFPCLDSPHVLPPSRNQLHDLILANLTRCPADRICHLLLCLSTCYLFLLAYITLSFICHFPNIL